MIWHKTTLVLGARKCCFTQLVALASETVAFLLVQPMCSALNAYKCFAAENFAFCVCLSRQLLLIKVEIWKS